MHRLKIMFGILVVCVLCLGAFMLTAEPATKNTAQIKMRTTSITEGLRIKKYPGNYACFKFEMPDGQVIICDPFNMNETVKPDIVTESHQHSDHTDVSELLGSYKLITAAGKYNEKGIKITGYSGKHDKGGSDGSNFMFVFDINGIKIAHFASQGEIPSEETLQKIGKIDILLLQASIKPQYAQIKLNLEESKTIVQTLKPQVLIPEHGSFKLGKALSEYMGLKFTTKNDGIIDITRSGLDELESPEIINLDTQLE